MVLIVVLISIAFVACGGGGASATSTPEEKKSTLNQTEQNISFSKYDDGYYKVGQERKYERENDVVIDLVTGLQWQDTNETDDHDISFDWAEAQSYCSTLVLNGHNDWRLPTVHELKSLVVYNRQYPAMTDALKNIDVFDYGVSLYWSSEVDIGNGVWVWTVVAATGGDTPYAFYNGANTRCVRGEERNSSVYKRDDDLGIVIDTAHNLVWQDDYRDNNNSVKRASYHDALNYCESLVLAKKDDWRLPNITELYSLTDKKREYPSLDPTFKKVVTSEYWSSTTEIGYPDNKWTVNFAFGMDGTWVKVEKDDVFVRCVRGGR